MGVLCPSPAPSSSHPYLEARLPTRRETRAGCVHGKSGSWLPPRRTDPIPGPRGEPELSLHPEPPWRAGRTQLRALWGSGLGAPSPGRPSHSRGQTLPSADPGAPGASSGATRGARRSLRATGWGKGESRSYLGTESRDPSISMGAQRREAESAGEGRKSAARGAGSRSARTGARGDRGAQAGTAVETRSAPAGKRGAPRPREGPLPVAPLIWLER